MSLTVTQKRDIGRVCTILASEELDNGQPHGGALDEGLPLQLFACTEGLEMLYNLDNTHADLEIIGNDLISKCRHYAKAITLMESGGSNPDISAPTIITSPISITGADFYGPVKWKGINGSGITILSTYTLQIFWNGLNRFLVQDSEWLRTPDGFDIVVNGTTITSFDATTTNLTDIFYIFISV